MKLGKNQQKSWFRKPFLGFTLVELIVVITILAILGAIGFLSIWGYSSRARDSARVADTSNIAKSLDVSIITVGNYPTPDGAFSVTYSGWSVWNQGTAGNNVMQVFRTSIGGGGLWKKPVDPLDNTEYVYSSLTFGKAYQIQVDYEGDINTTALQIPEFSHGANAASGNPTIAYIRGNYGGLTAKTVTGGLTYVLAVPSIITNTGTIAGWFLRVESDALSGSLMFHGKTLKNASYFNPKTVVYSGSTLPVSDTSGQIAGMMNLLKSVYAVSDITSNSNINSLLTTSSTGSLVILGSSIISGQLGGTVSTNNNTGNETPNGRGEQVYTSPGNFTWVVPAGVTSVSVVVVGAGGGVWNSPINTVASGGGWWALAYWTFSVTPGTSMSVVVGGPVIWGAGGASTFWWVMTAGGGGAGLIGSNSIGGAGGVRSGGTGWGNGGSGGNGATSNLDYSGGGGGAGGYSGNGGAGGSGAWQSHQDWFAGSGGGGGGGTTGGGAGGGGWVGIYGQWTSGGGGVRATNNYTQGGFGGSGGSNGTYPTGGNYGAGCGMSWSASGWAWWAVRIIWGAGRAFPSTDTGI